MKFGVLPIGPSGLSGPNRPITQNGTIAQFSSPELLSILGQRQILGQAK